MTEEAIVEKALQEVFGKKLESKAWIKFDREGNALISTDNKADSSYRIDHDVTDALFHFLHKEAGFSRDAALEFLLSVKDVTPVPIMASLFQLLAAMHVVSEDKKIEKQEKHAHKRNVHITIALLAAGLTLGLFKKENPSATLPDQASPHPGAASRLLAGFAELHYPKELDRLSDAQLKDTGELEKLFGKNPVLYTIIYPQGRFDVRGDQPDTIEAGALAISYAKKARQQSSGHAR